MRFVFVALVLLTASPCFAQIDERQVRRDCRWDATRLCPAEAARCFVKEDEACRTAIINCMMQRLDKLRPKCTRHFH